MKNESTIKSSLVLEYTFGVDAKNQPKVVTQNFSKVNLSADEDSFKNVGLALGALLDTEDVNVLKFDTLALGSL